MVGYCYFFVWGFLRTFFVRFLDGGERHVAEEVREAWERLVVFFG